MRSDPARRRAGRDAVRRLRRAADRADLDPRPTGDPGGAPTKPLPTRPSQTRRAMWRPPRRARDRDDHALGDDGRTPGRRSRRSDWPRPPRHASDHDGECRQVERLGQDEGHRGEDREERSGRRSGRRGHGVATGWRGSTIRRHASNLVGTHRTARRRTMSGASGTAADATPALSGGAPVAGPSACGCSG